jgi:hypothetical protein
MHRPIVLSFLSALVICTLALAQAPAPASPAPAAAARNESAPRLPVKKVVLYKNGVGYFEHAARVRGSQELNIDFTTAQLNDVLKSLTVLNRMSF